MEKEGEAKSGSRIKWGEKGASYSLFVSIALPRVLLVNITDITILTTTANAIINTATTATIYLTINYIDFYTCVLYYHNGTTIIDKHYHHTIIILIHSEYCYYQSQFYLNFW